VERDARDAPAGEGNGEEDLVGLARHVVPRVAMLTIAERAREQTSASGRDEAPRRMFNPAAKAAGSAGVQPVDAAVVRG
jgi:hypothetical protein